MKKRSEKQTLVGSRLFVTTKQKGRSRCKLRDQRERKESTVWKGMTSYSIQRDMAEWPYLGHSLQLRKDSKKGTPGFETELYEQKHLREGK